ncbi:DUF3570 domain-containing protein [Neptunicella marina]|uniref:DUF3570 domain-containing protein n=1 Tax=Neptunicella marina TaxID=2125989 RepID=A0A8J6J018_9ALTE|nr:DUF3570 domain-containing protein [Neptunicella marina]MBC3767518.1 DUF3570 domain-containing protein [Neptunicella marina]
MQLTQNKNISHALLAASCTLLGVTPVAQAAGNSEDGWKIDTALLLYSEQDRVSAVESVIAASKDFGDQHIFSGKLVIDTLTGSSASGAVPQDKVQTFTRPSGNGQYQIEANTLPLDDTFHDTRVQLNAQWTQPVMENTRVSSGVHFSKEYDYLSLAVNASLARDFNNKNTTVSAGFSYANDTIDPEGGRPVGFSGMVINQGQFSSEDAYKNAFDLTRQDGSDTKSTLDLMFGLTQTINRRMIMQLNYGFSKVDGYLTDPFKVLSVVDQSGTSVNTLYENRPDNRTKHNIFVQGKYAFDSGVADVSYRFATDDWDIDSHTVDSKFRFNLSDNSYLQPHVRFYQQSAANFYQPFLTQADPLPAFATADYRLGEMTAFTLGLKYGMTLESGNELAFRVEYYQQNPKNNGTPLPGQLQQQDLFPSVKALMAQVSYSF